MPGPVSDLFQGTPICKCQHFKDVHVWPEGYCDACFCNCRKFEEIPFEDTDLGLAINDLIDAPSATQKYFIFLGCPSDKKYLIQYDFVVWTAHRDFNHQAVAFFYITAPVSAIVASGFTLDDIWKNQEFNSRWQGRWMAELYIQNDSLNIPIKTLKEVFPEWNWLRFPRQNTLIPADLVKPFLELTYA